MKDITAHAQNVTFSWSTAPFDSEHNSYLTMVSKITQRFRIGNEEKCHNQLQLKRESREEDYNHPKLNMGGLLHWLYEEYYGIFNNHK